MSGPWWVMVTMVALIAGIGLGYSASEAAGRAAWATPTPEAAAPMPRWVEDRLGELWLRRGQLAQCQEELRQERARRQR